MERFAVVARLTSVSRAVLDLLDFAAVLARDCDEHVRNEVVRAVPLHARMVHVAHTVPVVQVQTRTFTFGQRARVGTGNLQRTSRAVTVWV